MWWYMCLPGICHVKCPQRVDQLTSVDSSEDNGKCMPGCESEGMPTTASPGIARPSLTSVRWRGNGRDRRASAVVLFHMRRVRHVQCFRCARLCACYGITFGLIGLVKHRPLRRLRLQRSLRTCVHPVPRSASRLRTFRSCGIGRETPNSHVAARRMPHKRPRTQTQVISRRETSSCVSVDGGTVSSSPCVEVLTVSSATGRESYSITVPRAIRKRQSPQRPRSRPPDSAQDRRGANVESPGRRPVGRARALTGAHRQALAFAAAVGRRRRGRDFPSRPPESRRHFSRSVASFRPRISRSIRHRLDKGGARAEGRERGASATSRCRGCERTAGCDPRCHGGELRRCVCLASAGSFATALG